MESNNMSITPDNKNLGKKTASGFLWTFSAKFSGQFVSLIVSILLARFLTPEDYSIVGIVTIFFTFGNVLVTGGLNTALIQKKDATIKDYSSVLWISVLLSILIYVIIFFCAPAIAALYEQPILIPVFRIMGITLIINALKAVLSAYLSNRLQFHKFFFSTVISLVLSGVVGIVMALRGFGPWALVVQNMLNVIISTVILLFMARVPFMFLIAFRESASLFKYGWKMLVASLISVIYDETTPLIVGLKYSASDLSYYTKGKSFPNLLNSSISDTLATVLFPVMSKLQDDKERLLEYLRSFTRISSFLVFPMMIGMLMVSDSFVIAVLTEKWLPASIYIKIFCIVYMLNTINAGNMQVIRAIGRSDTILIMEIVKKVSFAGVIVAAVCFTDSPEYLGYASVLNAVIAMLVNALPNRWLMQYKFRHQAQDLAMNLATSLLMGVVVFLIGRMTVNIYVLLVLQVLGGAATYFVLNLLCRNKSLRFFIDAIKKFLNQKRKDVMI